MPTNNRKSPKRNAAARSSVARGSALWPCPNRCNLWARCTSIDLRGHMPNHHSRCEHYNASLMDVWSVRIPGEEHGCVTHCECDAHAMAMKDTDDPLEVVKIQMHREVYENLPDFGGF